MLDLPVRAPSRPGVRPASVCPGEIEVDSILPITLADITPELARRSGFKGVVDLLKTAKHGRGDNVYLIEFHYLAPGSPGTTR